MHKPTLFFSHSSTDKELVLSIKNKIEKKTGNSLDIFMSSDGQSIPFGTNWIHKIEEGLNSAQIMFVFVTENSMSSGWIYFEAGFAYSKGIQVIPVGIGVDIGGLKAPLNMLQGFNINSADSLNNFITIINQKFIYSFKSDFTKEDYVEINSFQSDTPSNINTFEKLISHGEYTILGINELEDGTIKDLNIDKMFNDLLVYCDNNNISYSFRHHWHEDICVVCGIKISYIKESEEKKIKFRISTHNFNKSLELYKVFMKILEQNDDYGITLSLNDNYSCSDNLEDRASIISHNTELFGLKKNNLNGYISKQFDFDFYISSTSNATFKLNYIISVFSNADNFIAENIIMLVSQLYDAKIIYKNE